MYLNIFLYLTNNKFMKKNNILSNSLILAVGGVLAKVFSAIYRIGLTRILGGVGIGLYQLVFPFYSLCVVFATAGLPMAISKIIAKHKNHKKKILKKCLLYTTILALSLTFVLILFSGVLSKIQGEDISICYIILAPTIIIISVASVLRGYFQGIYNFVPSAVSNICEQFVKLVVGLILSLVFVNISLIAGVVAAMVSIVVSEIVSLVVLLLYLKHTTFEKEKDGKFQIKFKDLLKDILPITLTNIILPISSFVDSVLIVNLLMLNFPKNMSVMLYGLESGAVASLISLPTIFSFAIASVLLPSLTKMGHSFNKNNKISLSLKIILIICVPCVLCFILIPERILSVLYGTRLNTLGIRGTAIAASLLSVSGIGVVFLAINQIYSSSLQSVDQRVAPVRNLIIAVLLKMLLEIMFIPCKMINIYGLAIGNTVCYSSAMLLNHLEIKQNFKLKINYKFAGKLILSNSAMLLAMLSVLVVKNSVWNTILAILIAVITYFFCLFKFKIFSKRDLATFKYKI